MSRPPDDLAAARVRLEEAIERVRSMIATARRDVYQDTVAATGIDPLKPARTRRSTRKVAAS